MRKRLAVFLLCAGALGAAEKKIIFPPGTKVAGPYSPGIVVGDLLYVSGQGAKGPDGKFPESVDQQVKQCLDNVKVIVEAAGLTMDHLVYTQLYSPNPQAWAEIDRAWAKYFPKNGPARGVLGVEKLPENTPVEINAVAVMNLADKQAVPGAAQSPEIPAAVMSRDRIFVSGVFGVRPDGSVPEDGAEQTKLALDRLGEVLRAAGADYRHMVFVNPYVGKSIGYEQMNGVYAKYFEFGNTPARATIHAAGLPNGANIEFTGVAVRDIARRQAVRPKNMPPSPTASPCVFAGDTLYCSAKSAFIPGPNSGTYASTVEEQVRMSIRNLLDGLEEGGLSLANVVATNVYLDDIADFPKMNRIYVQYFKGEPPTRTTVQQIPSVADRKPNERDVWPDLEQISVIAVK
jgi:reactive intermediate/imine deaminase